METLSISAKTPFSMKFIMDALKDWRLENSTANTLVVHGVNSRVYIYFESEVGSIDIHRLMMDYSDVKLAKSLLEVIADDSTVVVDNDFGTVLPGDEFVRRCKVKKDWDWRQSIDD